MKIINEAVEVALKSLNFDVVNFVVEHPRDEKNGDYSTNVALVLAKKIGQNPRELAEKLITSLQNDIQVNSLIDHMEVAGAGFINFYLKQDYLLAEAKRAVGEGYGRNDHLKDKKVMVEYTDPNPFKEMHIGHLMSNTIGESLSRIFEANGGEIKRACYQGDVGLHVAKSIWGLEKLLKEKDMSMEVLSKKDLQERQKFLGATYAYGATKFEEEAPAQAEMHELNKKIYQETDDEINAIYRLGRTWSLEYFETIYKRLGTKFDEYFFESEAGKVGLAVVDEAIEKGILEVGDEGAIVYKGEKDGMHTRVFRNKLGLPTYEAKDLGLAKTKYSRYPYDLSYIVTANEITEYFKVVLNVMSKLYPELRDKTTHIPHGVMKLTTGKMSSRTGKVVTAEGLLNDLKVAVLSKMGERQIENKEMVADQVAVGALKFTVLKQQIGGDIVYEPEKMTAMEGSTGPFVQYSYARAQSILRKVDSKKLYSAKNGPLSIEEMSLLRWIYRYPEVIEEAGKNYAPHLVATYIYELASRFNSFYQKCRVEELGKVNEVRYLLTQASASVLSSGLNALGIVSPTEM